MTHRTSRTPGRRLRRAAAFAAPAASAIVPPKDCGTITVHGKKYNIKADQLKCTKARTTPPHTSRLAHNRPATSASGTPAARIVFRCSVEVQPGQFFAIKSSGGGTAITLALFADRRAGLAGPADGARPRPADRPADPGVAVRLGGGHRPDRVVRRAGGAVAEAAARGGTLAAAARRRGAARSRGVEVVCGAIGVALLVARDVGRLRRAAGPAGQHRPDLRPRHLLGRPGVRERAVRRRVPRVQPVAGGRPRARAVPRRARARTRSALGRWPAALGLLGFTWIELASG